MSGGSYNYAFNGLEYFASTMSLSGQCDAAPQALRVAFRAHCYKVAEAMRAIEWNDSCDGDANEAAKILACIQPGDIDEAAREQLLIAAQGVIDALKRKDGGGR